MSPLTIPRSYRHLFKLSNSSTSLCSYSNSCSFSLLSSNFHASVCHNNIINPNICGGTSSTKHATNLGSNSRNLVIMNATRKRDLHTKKKKQVEQNRRGSHTSTSSTTITDDPILVSPPIVKQKFKPVKHNPLKAAASRPPETIAEILYLQRLKNPDSNFYIHHQPPPPPHPVTQSQYPSISRSPNAINRSPTTHRSNQSSSRSSSKSSRGSILAPILPSPLLQRVKQKPKANDFSQTPITLSATTKSLVTRLRDQLRYYAEVEICGRRFLVTKNDQVITNRLRDVKVGDEIKLNRVIELGSKDFTIKGNPYVAEQFYSIKATVLEQPLGPFVVKLKKKPHNRHVKHVTHKQPYTVLRISEVEVNKLI